MGHSKTNLIFAIALSVGAFVSLSDLKASAATIVGAASATASSSTTSIDRTIDQSGLFSNYLSGVTNFDTYLAANPIHDLGFTTEWFTAFNVVTATVTYNLGALLNIDRIALWNEDGVGFGTGNISFSTDGVTFTPLTTIHPIDNPINVNYGAEVFSLGVVALQFLRLDVSDCPQSVESNEFTGCGIGEIAFSSLGPAVNETPIPAALPLFATGLGALGLLGWRRKKKTAALAA